MALSRRTIRNCRLGFTTGYDAEVIPPEFEKVERLEKILQLRHIVGAVARLTTTT